MHHHQFENNSSLLAKPNAEPNLWELNLPEVTEEDLPLPSEGFSYEARLNHARFLLESSGHCLFEHRDLAMQTEPFVWTD
jgi:hypothetical protein